MECWRSNGVLGVGRSILGFKVEDGAVEGAGTRLDVLDGGWRSGEKPTAKT